MFARDLRLRMADWGVQIPLEDFYAMMGRLAQSGRVRQWEVSLELDGCRVTLRRYDTGPKKRDKVTG